MSKSKMKCYQKKTFWHDEITCSSLHVLKINLAKAWIIVEELLIL